MDINPEDVLTWEIDKLWNTLRQLTERNEYKEEKNKIKNGIKIEFPIQYIIQEWYTIYPSTKRVTIKGHGKYELKKFMNEIEDREEMMRDIILNNIQKEEIATPRT